MSLMPAFSAMISKPLERSGVYDCILAKLACITSADIELLCCICSIAELAASARTGPFLPKNGN